MTRRRSFVLVVAIVVLALVSGASATQQAVTGKLTITGSGTNWTLTFQNAATSTGPIKCWRYTFPPGIQATGIGAPPTGWSVGGNKPPPAPILGGKSDAGIPPGGTAAFRIITDKPFDMSGPPGIAAISEDCVHDGTAQVGFGTQTSPPPPPPTPKPKPCKCKTLTVELQHGRHPELVDSTPGRLSIDLWLHWEMDCTNGSGGCEGTITASPSVADKNKGLRIKRLKGKSRGGEITCKGPCSRLNGGNVHFRLAGGANFGEGKLARSVRAITLEVDRFCSKDLAPKVFEFVFGRNTGAPYIDYRKSDFNGNGISDGDEKKKK